MPAMSGRTASRGVGTLVLVACALVACGAPPPEPLLIGANPWAGSAPLFAARELQAFSPDEVRPVEHVTALQSRRALRTHELDGAAITIDELLRLGAAFPELELCVARVADVSAGGDAIVGLAELPAEGPLRIGAEPGGTSAYLVSRAIQLQSWPGRVVEVVPVATPNAEHALLEGTVSLVSTFEPAGPRLEALGMRRWFDSSRIPDEVVDLLVLHRAVATARPRDVARLRKAFGRGIDGIASDPALSARMAKRAGSEPAAFAASLGLLRFPRAEDEARLRAELPVRILRQAAALRAAGIAVDEALIARVATSCPDAGGAP